MHELNLDNNEMMKSSAAPSQSKEIDSEKEYKSKKELVELCNKSVLHGYDLAVELLSTTNNMDAVKVLLLHRTFIEMGLENSISEIISASQNMEK